MGELCSKQTQKKVITQETDVNEMKIRDFLDKNFKITVIKMVTELRRIINSESFNRDKNISTKQKPQG